MSAAVAFAIALLGQTAPECGADVPHIDRAAHETILALVESAGDDGRVSTRLFSEPLASALKAEHQRRDRGEALRLRPDWLSAGGDIDAVTNLSVYSLNRTGLSHIVMALSFTNAEGTRVYRRISMGCEGGRWRIRSVFLGWEDRYLTDLLAGQP